MMDDAAKYALMDRLFHEEPYINYDWLERKLNENGLRSIRQKIADLEEMTQIKEEE